MVLHSIPCPWARVHNGQYRLLMAHCLSHCLLQLVPKLQAAYGKGVKWWWPYVLTLLHYSEGKCRALRRRILPTSTQHARVWEVHVPTNFFVLTRVACTIPPGARQCACLLT